MRRWKAIVLAGATIAVASSAIAQELPLSGSADFYERYEAAAQITGTPVVGLVALGAGAAPAALQAAIPKDWQGEVCARLVSSDGRYEARGQYTLPSDWSGGATTLSYPTGYDKQLAALAPQSMAVLVSLGACEGQITDVAIAGWKSATEGSGALLMVNSFRADETYIILPSGADIGCMPVETVQRTAFDVTCAIPAEALVAGEPVEIELNRVRRGAIQPTEIIRIHVAR